jgi:hypothetical protein
MSVSKKEQQHVATQSFIPATLRLFPGITTATIEAFLKPPIQAVVLETFGMRFVCPILCANRLSA